ncbi:MAG: hypothetical protein HFJ51_03140 [Clostridia bacterium]|nr:hypothetical protein [Clostridia bacterium]
MYHIKKCFGKLNKRQTEEIGTLKSPTKPLYIAKQTVEKLKEKKEDLEKLLPEKFELESEIKEKQKEALEEDERLKILQELDNIENTIKLEKEKVNIHIKSKKELEQKKQDIDKETNEVKEVREKPKNLGLVSLLPIVFTGIAIILFILKQPIFGIVSVGFVLISAIIIILKKAKINKAFEQELDDIRKKEQDIENRKTLIENEIKSKEDIIKEVQNSILEKEKMQIENILAKYPNADKKILEDFNNRPNVFEKQKYINDLKLSITQKEYVKIQIAEKLEGLVEIEEKLKANEEILQDLVEYEQAINLAKEALEEAHTQMKESITPKFTENLSNSIESITSGRYKKVKVNEENGLILETENRKLCNSRLFESAVLLMRYIYR